MDFEEFLCGVPAANYIFQNHSYEDQIEQAVKILEQAEHVLIGAGAGLSAAAGLVYSGKRFTENFGEFIQKYGVKYMADMYMAAFYPFPTEEEQWGYWSRHSVVNRIRPKAMPLYQNLYELVKDKKHFVLTTNVDHQFWKANFKDEDIFATQGDYGLIQCAKGCHLKTYDAIELFVKMDHARTDCRAPSHMVPKCPVCGGPMDMNLRKNQYFVEDLHWHEAAKRYGEFLEECLDKKVALLELGVGFNTPSIIRFPFDNAVQKYETWNLIRLNLNEAVIPENLGPRAVGINADLEKSMGDILDKLRERMRDGYGTE